MFDVVVIGAGFAGAVMAEQFATRGNKRVLVVEKRQHIAGNCYDYTDDNGILVHKYGPHLFHTSNENVFSYLSQFTDWIPYNHKVLAYVDGQYVPVPFNFSSLHKLFPASMATALEEKLLSLYKVNEKIPILELRKTDDAQLKALADYIYEKIFAGYTAKQWGCSPEEISPEVTARVPVFLSLDDTYFQDKYQLVPKRGYTDLFGRILAQPNIRLMLNTDYSEILTLDAESRQFRLFGNPFEGEIVYTGMIDQLFDYCYGELPYRSLQFQFEYQTCDVYQPTATVNYPNNYDYTRITEFKHITQQKAAGTTIVKEYPQDYDRHDPERNVPYYPVFNEANQLAYSKYEELAAGCSGLTLVGRLAEYKYYDMDDVVARALEVYESRFA